MSIKDQIHNLKKLCLGGALALGTFLPAAASTPEKSEDVNKEKTEVRASEGLAVEGIVTAKDEKEARKAIKKIQGKYGYPAGSMERFIDLAGYVGQEHLFLETIAKETKPKKVHLGKDITFYRDGRYVTAHDGVDLKFKVPELKGKLWFVRKGEEKFTEVDVVRTVVNAKDILEKSGIEFSLSDLSMKKEDAVAQDMIKRKDKAILMELDENNRLHGTSRVVENEGGEIARLVYEHGEFISGEVNGKPITKVNNNKQMAARKVLEDYRQSVK